MPWGDLQDFCVDLKAVQDEGKPPTEELVNIDPEV
jgi:hypothetical protein